MTDTLNKWQWYVGHDEEVYTSGPYDTRDEAAYIAREEYGGGHIVEAKRCALELSKEFGVGDFLERIDEAHYDFQNENGDPVFDISTEAQSRLEICVRATITQWQKDEALTFVPGAFSAQRNEEWIEGAIDAPKDGDAK